MKHKSFALLILFTCLTVAAWAHGGMTHVIGVVKAISPTSISVETTEHKTIEVMLVKSTVYEHEGKAAAAKDIQVGDRVVIHAMPVKGKLQAHEVRFAAAWKTSVQSK